MSSGSDSRMFSVEVYVRGWQWYTDASHRTDAKVVAKQMALDLRRVRVVKRPMGDNTARGKVVLEIRDGVVRREV